MNTLAVALVICTGCSLHVGERDDLGSPALDEPADPGATLMTYNLHRVRSMAGEGSIAGIDSDRADGIYIAYRMPTGGYYENADVHVVHLDATGTKVSDWLYDDEYTRVQGIAFDGAHLWLNYNSDVTGDHNHLRKLDAATGETLAAFATEAGIFDVTTTERALLLSSPWNEVIALDPTTGGEISRTHVDAFGYSTQEGIAACGHLRWVASRASAELALVDGHGTRVARALTSELDSWNYDSIRLAWDGSKVLVTTRNQIVWLAPDMPVACDATL